MILKKIPLLVWKGLGSPGLYNKKSISLKPFLWPVLSSTYPLGQDKTFRRKGIKAIFWLFVPLLLETSRFTSGVLSQGTSIYGTKLPFLFTKDLNLSQGQYYV